MEKVLEISHISKTYGSRIAVNDVSFDVYKGEIFGFLGSNGAGKTTLIKIITGLLKADSGDVKVCGSDIKTDFTGAARNIGAIIENPDMYGHMSGYENLKYFSSFYPDITDEDIWEAIRAVDMQARAKEKLKKYSLGMKQRMGIAQAIMAHPKLLVLDEPTNGLDPNGIKEIRDLFKKLKEKGVTIFVSSHILSEMQQMCDRVAIINNGELITVKGVNDILHGEGAKIFVEVKADDAEKVKSVLKEKFGIEDIKINEEDIRFQALYADIPKINAALVEQGVKVSMIKAIERTLEDIFIEVTASKQHGKIV